MSCAIPVTSVPTGVSTSPVMGFVPNVGAERKESRRNCVQGAISAKIRTPRRSSNAPVAAKRSRITGMDYAQLAISVPTGVSTGVSTSAREDGLFPMRARSAKNHEGTVSKVLPAQESAL